MVTNDRTYGQRTDASVNPNDTILRHLKDAGVDLAVCGQSARAQHYDQGSLLPFVHLNFSAVVTFINLAMRGYVRVTE
jgi:intracellular sulfur oxidation DsrE/DsrF family protein